MTSHHLDWAGELYIKLYEEWKGGIKSDRCLTVDQEFDKQGGVAGSLTRRVNEEYENLPDDAHRLTMRRIMLRMVELEGGEAVRRRVLASELVYPDREENERKDKVLNCLIESRLIVTGTDTESHEQYYEPAHDYLVRGWDKLQDWISNDQKEGNLVLQRRLNPAAEEYINKQGSLWNADPRLILLKEILNSNDCWFNQHEKRFVENSLKRKRLNTSIRWVSTIGVLITAVGLTWYFNLLRIEAQTETVKSLTQASKIFLANKNKFDALISAVKAGQLYNDAKLNKPDILNKVKTNLVDSAFGLSEFNRLEGHTSQVSVIEFSSNGSNGNLIATASSNGIVKLWKKSGEEIFSFPKFKGIISKLKFSEQNKIAIIGSSGNLQIWRWEENNSTLIKKIEGCSQTGCLGRVEISPDEKLIATINSTENNLSIWNWNGEVVAKLPITGNYIKTTWQFIPNSQKIMLVKVDGQISLWDWENNQQTHFKNDPRFIDSKILKFSHHGNVFATFNSPKQKVQLWQWNKLDINTIKEIDSINITETYIPDLLFNSDSNKILIIKANSPINSAAEIWHWSNGRRIDLYNNIGSPKSVFLSPNREKIAIANSKNSTVRFWNWNGSEIISLNCSRNSVNAIGISPDNETIGIAHANLISLCKVNSFELGTSIDDKSSGINDILFSPDGKLFVVIRDHWHLAEIWEINGKKTEYYYHPQHGSISKLKFSPDSQTIAIERSDRTLVLWDWKNKINNSIQTKILESSLVKVIFSKDDKCIITISKYNTVDFWQWNKNKIMELNLLNKSILSTDIDQSGRLIAIATRDDQISLTSPRGVNIINIPFDSKNEYIKLLKISPSGKFIAIASKKHLELRNKQGHLIATIPASIDSIYFSPDENKIILITPNNKIYLWQLSDKDRSLVFLDNSVGAPVKDIKFSLDAQHIIIMHHDGTYQLWQGNYKTNKEKFVKGSGNIIFTSDGQGYTIISPYFLGIGKLNSSKFTTITTDQNLNDISAIDINENEQLIALAKKDVIQIWNSKGEKLADLEYKNRDITSLKFNHDSSILISGDSTGKISLLELNINLNLQLSCTWLRDYLNRNLNILYQNLCTKK